MRISEFHALLTTTQQVPSEKDKRTRNKGIQRKWRAQRRQEAEVRRANRKRHTETVQQS